MNYKIIEDVVSKQFDVSIDEVRRGGRKGFKRTVTDARHFIWYVLHVCMGYRVSAIAREYNVTVRNVFLSVSSVRQSIQYHPYMRGHLRQIIDNLKDLEIL